MTGHKNTPNITEKPPELTKKADAPDIVTVPTPTQEPNLSIITHFPIGINE